MWCKDKDIQLIIKILIPKCLLASHILNTKIFSMEQILSIFNSFYDSINNLHVIIKN